MDWYSIQPMKNTENAFRWIFYKISGGLAAQLHGAKRELADIDIEVSDADVGKVAQDVKPFIIFGPTRYIDENWNLELMTLSDQAISFDVRP